MIVIKTNLGDIKLELDQAATPNTCDNFLKYVKEGVYNGTVFHRVIDGFMIQGGGFNVDMEQQPTKDPIENEADKCQSNKRGTIAMARTSDPHSATAQFFINVRDNDFLDFKSKDVEGWGYCVFGHVVDGLDVVDKISKVSTTNKAGHQDVPAEEVVMSSIMEVQE